MILTPEKSKKSDLALEKFWVTHCGWLRLFMTVALGITITNCWKLFCNEVQGYHNKKLVGIREFMELIAQDCFNDTFSTNNETPEKKIPPLDEVNDGMIVSTCRALNFPVVFIPPQRPSIFPT